jgi:hypothetical protein
MQLCGQHPAGFDIFYINPFLAAVEISFDFIGPASDEAHTNKEGQQKKGSAVQFDYMKTLFKKIIPTAFFLLLNNIRQQALLFNFLVLGYANLA